MNFLRNLFDFSPKYNFDRQHDFPLTRKDGEPNLTSVTGNFGKNSHYTHRMTPAQCATIVFGIVVCVFLLVLLLVA